MLLKVDKAKALAPRAGAKQKRKIKQGRDPVARVAVLFAKLSLIIRRWLYKRKATS